MMKIVKKNLKKYVNRCYLKSIFDMDRGNRIFKLLSKGVQRLEILSIEEFKEIFRRLVYYYFTSDMVAHLLSSNRLSKNTIREHLKRRREIMSHIFCSIEWKDNCFMYIFNFFWDIFTLIGFVLLNTKSSKIFNFGFQYVMVIDF